MADLIQGDRTLTGVNRFLGDVILPAETITNTHIDNAADIGRAKMRHPVRFGIYETGTPVAVTRIVYECRVSAATVNFFRAVLATANTSSNTVTVDLKKSTSGGAFASILSAAIVLDSGNTDRVPEAATISSASLVQGDILEIVVTVSSPNGVTLSAYGEIEELGA